MTDALRSLYPLPTLPSVSDLARLADFKTMGDPCRSSNYRIVAVSGQDKPEQACQRVNMRVVNFDTDAGSMDWRTVNLLLRGCGQADERGVRLSSNDPSKCVFIDRRGSVYLAATQAAQLFYEPCRAPKSVLCRV